MGADLYINTLYQPNRQKWDPEFKKAIPLRDSLAPGTLEHSQAQEQVEECYNKLRGRGYFRDPYNDYDLLWKFGLSWWTDVVPMLNADNQLSAEQAEVLLAMLKERTGVFQEKLAELTPRDRRYFLDAYAELQKFLNEAIELKTLIDASL